MVGLIVDTDSRMTTRDGVPLAADVYRPADDACHPVLLHRTPYDRTNPTLVSALVADPVWLARRGYAVVVQDVRGRFGSGGEIDFFHQELDDGYDAVEWAAAQPWSDGNIGSYGSSYHAMTTFQAVAARPPHLRAALAMVGATDLAPTVRPGGLFELGFLATYALSHSVEALRRVDLPGDERAAVLGRIATALADPVSAVARLPLTGLDVLGDRAIAPFWSEWLDHEPGDPYWHRPTLAEHPDRVDVPLLQVVAFRDFMAPTMLALFEAVQHLDERHRLIAGPWAHGGTYTGIVGARTFPDTTGGVGTWGPVLAGWFGHHLRGSPAPVGERVRYYVTGENRWAGSPCWPPTGTETVLHLGGGAVNSAVRGGGTLTAEPRSGPPDVLRVDPLDPFPTCGGLLSAPGIGPDGVQDRRAVEQRGDVLVYTSEPLVTPLPVAGPIILTVFLSSTAPDADVCATLVDIEPDGFAAGVSEGALRTRYRSGGVADWLAPGVVVELAVPLHQTAHTFRVGHRVRLEIAGANFPRLSRNLHNTVVPERGTEADAVIAEHTVHRPSRLVLHTVGRQLT